MPQTKSIKAILNISYGQGHMVSFKIFSLQPEWQYSKECICHLRNIAMCDFQESVTTRQTHGQKDVGLIESITTLYRDREIHPTYQRLTVHNEACRVLDVHIFDMRVDFPVPVQSGG